MKKEDYGINGEHARIGNEISMPEFKGKTLEALKNIGEKLDALNEEQKTMWAHINQNTKFRHQIKGAGILLGLISLVLGIALGILTIF